MGHRQLKAPPAGGAPAPAPLRARVSAVVVAAAVGVIAVRLWVLEPLVVHSDSMEPTVATGGTVLLVKFSAAQPSPGELVAFRHDVDGTLFLKRAVAVAGQSIAIRDGRLYVDGELVPEPYVDLQQTDGTFFPLSTVPSGHVFVLGDNRAASVDSRDFGAVPLEAIEGAVLWAF